MLESSQKGVTIDSCPDCEGIWFDIEEIYDYASKIKPTPSFVPNDEWFSMHTKGLGDCCPCCQEKALEIGGIAGQTYRRCTWCGGIFMSKGSLRAILDRDEDEDTLGDVFTAGEVLLMPFRVILFVAHLFR
jgi:Zn-finger nucleic acid-binding protein